LRSSNVAEIAARIEEQLRANGNPERAVAERKYLKSDLEFYGASMGAIRALVKAFVRGDPSSITHDHLIEIVLELWARPIFERRMTAVALLESCPAVLSPRDIPVIEQLIRASKTWALVDGLAVNITGELVLRHPASLQTLEGWATDPDFWIRRSVLLAHLKPLRKGEAFSSFCRHADSMLGENEFFIRKAIGWVLREVAKRKPDDVFDWLAPRTHIASGVTMREATRYLDADRRAELMTAYKEKRSAV
jgi:3-methyladenine DNA glycosylase AlkD